MFNRPIESLLSLPCQNLSLTGVSYRILFCWLELMGAIGCLYAYHILYSGKSSK